MNIKYVLFLIQFLTQSVFMLLLTKKSFLVAEELQIYWFSALATLPLMGLAELGSANILAKKFRAISAFGIKSVIIFALPSIVLISSLLIGYQYFILLTGEPVDIKGIDRTYIFLSYFLLAFCLKCLGAVFANIIYTNGLYFEEKLSRISANLVATIFLLAIDLSQSAFGVLHIWVLHGFCSALYYFYVHRRFSVDPCLDESINVGNLIGFFAIATPGIFLSFLPQFFLHERVGEGAFKDYISLMPIIMGVQGLVMVFSNIYGSLYVSGQINLFYTISKVFKYTLFASLISCVGIFFLNSFYQSYWLEKPNFTWSPFVLAIFLLFYIVEWTQVSCTQIMMLSGESRYLLQAWFGFILYLILGWFFIHDMTSFLSTLFLVFFLAIYPRNLFLIYRRLKHECS